MKHSVSTRRFIGGAALSLSLGLAAGGRALALEGEADGLALETSRQLVHADLTK